MVSTRPPISKSPSHFTNSLVTVPRAPITIGINVTFMLHNFLQFSSKLKVFFLFIFFQFYSIVSRGSKAHNFASSLSFVDYYEVWSSGLDLVILLYVKIPLELVSFSRTDAGLCIYHLVVWSYLNFLHDSQWITLLTQSCLVLYSFCANFLRSLIMWLIVLSLSPHNLHYYYHYFTLCDFFSSVVTGDLSLGSDCNSP